MTTPFASHDIDTLPDGAAIITDEELTDLIDQSASDLPSAPMSSFGSSSSLAPAPPTTADLPTRTRSSFEEEPTRKAHAPKAPKTATKEQGDDVVDVSSWDNFRSSRDEN